MKEFILSDESRNSKGFKVLTSGIYLKRFEQNPVMYYNHAMEMGVIGRWENIRIKGDKLCATPVFDMNDPFASKIASKVEGGFIKAASIGIDECRMEVIGGESIVTSCRLYECSVCDIPSNENSLALHYGDKVITDTREIAKLTLKERENMNDLAAINEALGLQSNASIDSILEAIRSLKQSSGTEQAIDDAIKMKYVCDYERPGLITMAFSDPTAFSDYMEKRKSKIIKDREQKGSELIFKAIKEGVINNDRNGKVKSFWLNAFVNDFETAKYVLESFPRRTSISSMIKENGNGDGRSGWTLSDYRKKAPQELKNNPGLYQTLLDQEKQKNNINH